jgi:HK97 family phage major capsid protein
MNRKSLLTLLKANGYAEANPTIESVKSYLAKLASEGVELQDKEGNPLNIDTIWAAKSVLTLAGTDADTALSESQRKSIIADAKGSTSPHGDGEVEDRAPKRFTIGNAQRKAYERKISEGRSVFQDVDQAEAFSAWCRLAIAGEKSYGQKATDIAICRKAQVEFNNQLGGALVPQEFAPQLIWLTEQYGVAKKIANVVPMSSDSKAYPRKTGIVSMTPIGEGATITPTDNTYGNVTLNAKKYGVLFNMSRELFEDSAINISDDIARSIAEAESIAVDSAYFLGDGSATYANQIGLANALPAGALGTATAWGSMDISTFTTAIGSVQNVNAARLAFVCSRQFFAQVMLKLDKAVSQFKELTTGMPGMSATFLGYPVFFSQVMPVATATAVKSCYFGDFVGASMIGDRRMLEIATSDQFYFNSDSIAVRGTSRFNVSIHGDGRGSTVGPIFAIRGN